MSRTTLLILVLIVVGVGGYFLIAQTDETPDPVADLTETVDEPAEDTPGTVPDDAGETPGEAEPVEDTAFTGTDPVEAPPATEMDAAEDTAVNGTEAVEDTTGAAAEVDGEGAVEEPADTTTATTTEVVIPDYLTVEGFDAERAREALDAADVGPVERASLQAGISMAEDDVALRRELLERLRDALGF